MGSLSCWEGVLPVSSRELVLWLCPSYCPTRVQVGFTGAGAWGRIAGRSLKGEARPGPAGWRGEEAGETLTPAPQVKALGG